LDNAPSGTELARPFVPAKNLEVSKRFNLKIGFQIALDTEDVTIFRIGVSNFLLTPFDHADNFMMQFMVDDLDAWWARIESLQLAREFGVPEPRPPKMQPWGLRVAYFVDPSGVLWHVAQRRPSTPHDS
jgi:catechol 2,3-dioxygenase-like lactoylglutathione lyase family enzyme